MLGRSGGDGGESTSDDCGLDGGERLSLFCHMVREPADVDQVLGRVNLREGWFDET